MTKKNMSLRARVTGWFSRLRKRPSAKSPEILKGVPTELHKYYFQMAKKNKKFVSNFKGSASRRANILSVIKTSHEKLGFFSSSATRIFEYPWHLENIKFEKGDFVIDLGAGYSPLPIMLAERGAKVITVDYSPTKRDVNKDEKGGGWGFLDYSTVVPGMVSLNIDFADLPEEYKNAAVVYSVSVVEHMPVSIRKKVIAQAARVLKVGGSLVLTVDIKPGTFWLWNKDQGKVVEPHEIHGDLITLVSELSDNGLALEKLEMRREIPYSAVEIVCIRAVKIR